MNVKVIVTCFGNGHLWDASKGAIQIQGIERMIVELIVFVKEMTGTCYQPQLRQSTLG